MAASMPAPAQDLVHGDSACKAAEATMTALTS